MIHIYCAYVIYLLYAEKDMYIVLIFSISAVVWQGRHMQYFWISLLSFNLSHLHCLYAIVYCLNFGRKKWEECKQAVLLKSRNQWLVLMLFPRTLKEWVPGQRQQPTSEECWHPEKIHQNSHIIEEDVLVSWAWMTLTCSCAGVCG